MLQLSLSYLQSVGQKPNGKDTAENAVIEESADSQQGMAIPKAACPLERPQAAILDIAHNVVDLESHERHDPYYKAVDITKRVCVDIPDFDERIDPQVYPNWLATLETYFDWYELSNGRIVRFAILKFVGQAQIWWSGVENQLQNTGQHIFTWG